MRKAGWRQAGGWRQPGWRQAGGLEASLKDLQLLCFFGRAISLCIIRIRHEGSHRLQCATNLTSFSRAHDMCGHVRAACARRCSKEFHVICRVRGGLIATLFSNASSYHVRLDKNAATPHVCTCRVCMSKPSSLRNVHMGFAEFEED